MAAVTDALRLAAPVANALRRVTPIISAVVVAAVRRGLRVALATASRPGTRRVRPLTVPSSRPAGPTRCGLPSTRLPAVSAPPANSATMLPAATASHSAPAPASSSRTAAVPATQPGRVALATAWLRMAARGATLVALRAGRMAATTVTASPVATPIRTVAGVRPNDAGASSAPRLARSWRRPSATPKPAPRPSSDDSRPSTAASPSTVRKTWPRAAPTQRSSASCRLRWATRMVKVL